MPFIFLVIGLLAGVLSGVFGIGGGVVIVPALIFLAGMLPITATGTSLAALLLPVGALGAYEYYRKGHLQIGSSVRGSGRSLRTISHRFSCAGRLRYFSFSCL